LKLLIDADSCPVLDLALKISSDFEIESKLFCDTSHEIIRNGIETIMVPKGRDSVDFTLVNALSKNDIVITQDLGLAAMVLARGGYVIDPNGRELTSDNIDELLYFRHVGQMIRRTGGRTKGPKSRTDKNNIAFEVKFRQLCERAILAEKGRQNDAR